MVRIVEILVAANAVCGIAAFLTARGLIRRAKRKMGLDENEFGGTGSGGRFDSDDNPAR